jgi:hypothetical protein
MLQFAILLVAVSMLIGCASSQGAHSVSKVLARVQILGFDSCPNTPVMHQRLLAALAQMNVDEPVDVINQDALANDDLRRGWPAPTVLIDGSDLFGMSPPQSPAMGCRVYRGPGGVPSVTELAQRLASAGVKGSHQ